jgi:RNA polymerase sigma factor (sigma-70 family)
LGTQSTSGRQRAAPGPTRTEDEAALIARIATRDLRAFEQLYRLYQSRLSRFLTNLTRRPNLVEEVLNDTLMVVWDRAATYNGASKVSTWIFAIAYRKALKAMRKQDEPVEDKQAETRPSLDADPEQQIGSAQLQEILVTAMAELSADHRAVVDLTYFHEIGYREIADIMECPVDTVKTRMFYARRHLKGKLAGQLADWL